MSKKEERDNFWISVGPESGYLGTIAEETARKNDGGISPDGERLGWKNACDDSDRHIGEEVLENPCDYNCPPFCFGDAPANTNATKQPDSVHNDTLTEQENPNDFATRYPYGDPCDCGKDCNCGDSKDCGCGSKGGMDGNDAHASSHTGSHNKTNAAQHMGTGKLDCEERSDCMAFSQDCSASGGVTVGYTPIFGANCDCGILPLPGLMPIEEATRAMPRADVGPEHQNTQE